MSTIEITNPILPGFNPDPSIIRVGSDYYVATSTFEWYPGVQIHHSRDLVHWHLVTRPLRRASQLDMLGNPDSGGIWAPCLSYHAGRFYLIYTDVKHTGGNFKDTHNYLVTADRIDGDWSDPVYLNSSGFDPSLFHDEDGRKWLLNMVRDYRPDRSPFGGIHLQEYCEETSKLIGPVRNIFRGTELDYTEGPHLYKRDGYYYLLTAEGGTGYNHAVTLARSSSITGPYELHPQTCILTAKDDPTAILQKSGHGDLVETPNGETYLVHLCGRPLPNRGRCTLGRETAIQKMEWREDGWLYKSDGSPSPALRVPAPDLSPSPWPVPNARDDFDSAELPIQYQWLRSPTPEAFYSLAERPGFLRLKGHESLSSTFTQALIARRQQAFCFTATTRLEFEPEHHQQLAGLVCYYNTTKYHYLYVSHDEEGGKYLGIMSCEGDPAHAVSFPAWDKRVSLAPDQPLYLRAEVNYEHLEFSWSYDGEQWEKMPVKLDYSLISDEAGKGVFASFTGAFVGMCCQDLAGTRKTADFDFFEYDEHEFKRVTYSR